MANSTQVAPHLTADELLLRVRKAQSPIEVRRWQLLHAVLTSGNLAASARMLHMDGKHARGLVRRYNEGGPAEMKDGRVRSGHPGKCAPNSLLNAEQRQALQEALLGPAPDGCLWSGPKVAAWIAAKTGRERVHPQRGWDWLIALGFSARRPRPRHECSATESERQTFKTALSPGVGS